MSTGHFDRSMDIIRSKNHLIYSISLRSVADANMFRYAYLCAYIHANTIFTQPKHEEKENENVHHKKTHAQINEINELKRN